MTAPMKKVLFLFAALTCAGFGSAQNIMADTVPALPPCVYCEIMANHTCPHPATAACCSISDRRPEP